MVKLPRTHSCVVSTRDRMHVLGLCASINAAYFTVSDDVRSGAACASATCSHAHTHTNSRRRRHSPERTKVICTGRRILRTSFDVSRVVFVPRVRACMCCFYVRRDTCAEYGTPHGLYTRVSASTAMYANLTDLCRVCFCGSCSCSAALAVHISALCACVCVCGCPQSNARACTA